jgi:hypothetical protein
VLVEGFWADDGVGDATKRKLLQRLGVVSWPTFETLRRVVGALYTTTEIAQILNETKVNRQCGMGSNLLWATHLMEVAERVRRERVLVAYSRGVAFFAQCSEDAHFCTTKTATDSCLKEALRFLCKNDNEVAHAS